MADLIIDDLTIGDRPISKLVEELDEMFPAKSPTPKDLLNTIMYEAGQRSVVEYIKVKLKDK
tara:strand:+ start:35 stop:220 length:186 start_codon:yes stop_codon:yes gene_type:complete